MASGSPSSRSLPPSTTAPDLPRAPMPPVAEDVHKYPRPPSLEYVPYKVRGEKGGKVVFEVEEGCLRVCETTHPPTYYIPRSGIAMEYVKPVKEARRTMCEWKGEATYFDLEVPGAATVSRAAWSYPSPTARFLPLKDYICFYATALDAIKVNGELVIPQPGDFYGGWTTSWTLGEKKGAPGTLHW